MRVDHILAGGGECGALARAIDWSASPIGPIETWSQALRSTVALMLHNHSGLLLWWGPKFVCIYNDAYRPILGAKHPRSMGQPCSAVWSEIWHIIGPMIETPFRGGPASTSDDLLLPLRRNDFLEEAHFRVAYSPVPDDTVPETRIGGVLATVTETTEQSYAERQLRTLRELAARSAAEAKTVEDACAAAAVTLADNRWDVPFALLYLFDAAGPRLVAQSGFGEEPPPDPGLWPLAVVAANRRIEVLEQLGEHALPASPWQERPHSAIVLPLASPEHANAYGVLVCGISPHRQLDTGYRTFFELASAQVVTAIRNARALEQVRERAEALAAIDRAKTTFFSNISHEFRTPLTLMLGPTEDALARPERALAGNDLETVYRNELRLLKLVNALLDFSRIEAGRMRAVYVPTDIAARTTELASMFCSAVERAGLAFRIDAAPISEPIYLDADMWEKIVLNLLSNALKFTFEGEIEVRLVDREAEVALVVRDTGAGIPAHELPKLFERFHRVEGAQARTHEGSGIGLALVHDLVSLHGGRVDVHSELGAGTTFTVTIPKGHTHLDPAHLDIAQVRGASETANAFVHEALRWLPEPAAAAPPRSSRGRVLVADDNADMREYVTRLLRTQWDVEAVGDGIAALASARQNPPNLVLTDVMMPKLDGFGLLAELRRDQITKSIPVVMLSARAGEESRVEGLQAGADDYLVKPFSARELIARVETHLKIRAARDQTAIERQRLLDMFMKVPAAIAILAGPQHVCEFANDTFHEMFQLDPIGRPLRDAFIDLEPFDLAFQTGERVELAEVTTMIMVDGQPQERLYRGTIEPWRDHAGNVGGLLQVFLDITERVHVERERDDLLLREHAARVDAEAANRAKDEFLAVISHELRTPLNAIMGWAHLLAHENVPADRHQHGLEVIERNARTQAQLIDDLLDVSRIISGKVRIDPQPVQPSAFVEAAIESVRLAANAKGVELRVELDPDVEQIFGDHDRLQQVVWNLLANAIKFTPREGHVRVRTERVGAYIEITVTDSGQGIATDFLPYVFERFSQADASFTRARGGLGLGLAIARHLVELHGGTIAVTSEGTGRGARFTVKLPIAPMYADAVTAGPSAPTSTRELQAQAIPDLDGVHVLVVDDEQDARDVLMEILERAHAQVSVAGSAAEAMAVLEEGRAAVLVSDIGMPLEDGFTLMRRIRALPGVRGKIPAVALTAYARPVDRQQALMVGYDRHVGKPIDPAELVAIVANLVAQQS